MANTRKPQRDGALKKGVFMAATGNLNIAALGIGALGGAALGSTALAALGAAAYVALAAWDLSSEKFWRRVLDGKPASAKPNVQATKMQDAETRLALDRIYRAREQINATINQASPSVAESVSQSLAALGDLNGRMTKLALRANDLFCHLRAHDRAALHLEAVGLAKQANEARDGETRNHFRDAAQAREDQVKSLTDVAQSRQRLIANLVRIVTILEGIPTRIVRMGALDAEAVDGVTDNVGQEIQTLNTELSAIEETLAVLAEIES